MRRQCSYVLMTFQGRRGRRIFETEVHKKKFLDAWRDLQQKMSSAVAVYGYCILDDKAVILAAVKDNSQIDRRMEEIWESYGELLSEITFSEVPSEEVMTEKEFLGRPDENREIHGRIEEALIWLHFLPVKEDYVIWAENYWWSSYQEYLGRNWMPFQIPGVCSLISEDEQKVRRIIKRKHREWKKYYLRSSSDRFWYPKYQGRT